MPSLRHCSGGPPPSAIHGRGRLPRHPSRGAPCATPAFGLWERGGRSEAKAKQQQRQDQKIAASLRSTAPTGERVHLSPGRPVGRLALAFAVYAPSRGRVEVLRSGQPGMDAGLAAPGHGWPMAAGPRSRTGARAWRAWASHRTKGAKALGYLGLFQVTRCKSQPFQGLLTFAALSTRSVDTWAFTALPSSHSLDLSTFGPRLLLATALGWTFRASVSRY